MTTTPAPEATIHAERAGSASGGYAQVAARDVTAGEARFGELTSLEPETWPEVLREHTALAGAVDSALRAANDLRARLEHVLRPDDSPPGVMPNPPMPISSTLAEKQRAVYFDACAIENVLRDVERRLAV